MKKRIVSILLCAAILCAFFPSLTTVQANAAGTYNPNAALAFAAEHCNDGKGLCAEFVSRCLNAGGCDSFSTSCTALVGQLRKRTDCTEHTIPVNPNKSVTIKDRLDEIAPGDPLFFHCSFQNNYQHALLCNGMDKDGLLKAYAHNTANDGSRAIYYNYLCPECRHPSIDYVTVFHFETDPPTLTGWMSESKLGDESNQFLTGNRYYLCYKLYDEESGKLYDSYGGAAYKVSMEVYRPDNSILCSYSFRNDTNWLSVCFPTAGTYRYQITVNGDFSDTISGSMEVKESMMTLSAQSAQEELKLTEQPSKTIELTVAGFHSNPLSVKKSEISNGAFSATLDSFDKQTVRLTVSAQAVGQGSITVSLFDALTSEKLATEMIDVTVTGSETAISYHANGGTGAPLPQKAYCGESVFLSTEKPEGKSYEVLFDANGGEMSDSTKRCFQNFTSWNTKADGTGETYLSGEYCRVNAPIMLFAQYDRCVLGDEVVPIKEGCRFIGWYDSPEYDCFGAPLGNYYAPGAEITQDLTLYAMWSASSAIVFGDLNFDGVISDTDLMKMTACVDEEIELDQTDAFLADIDADGDIDQDDASLLESLLDGSIKQEDLPAYQTQKQLQVEGIQETELPYGSAPDTDALAFRIDYGDDIGYSVSEGLTVTGFDPYQIGHQTLTVSFGQFSAECSVTVLPPDYLLNFDAGDGTVSDRQRRVTYGSVIGELPIPVRAGYIFLGWSFDESGTEYISKDTVYSDFESRTVYACWESGCSENSHAYEAVIVAPTCTQKGYTEHICTVCGASDCGAYVDTLVHSFAEGFCSLCGQKDQSYVPGMCDGGANCPGAVFEDDPAPNNWAHIGIDFCISNGLFFGESATSFSPNKTMTRAMLVTVLYRLEGTPAVTAENPFVDVEDGTWYSEAVVWAAENGIVTGAEHNLFYPEDDISREQIAAIFYRYASFKTYDTSFSGDLKSYPDEAEVSAWAYEPLCWATEVGLINGSGRAGESYLEPQQSATRAQVAAMFMRFINQFQ